MSEEKTWRWRLHGSYGSCLVLSALFILFGFLPDNGWWGINHLLFFPFHVKVIFAAVTVMALLPVSSRAFGCIVDRLSRSPRRVTGAVSVVISLFLFWFFRVAVHSLGDGYQRAFEIEQGKLFQSTEMLDFGVHVLIYRPLRALGLTDAATTAMALTSIVAGGVFVYMLAVLAPFRGRKKALFMAVILSLGITQFFFGYVESYTLLYLFSVWYIFLAFRAAASKTGFGVLTLAYLLAAFSHQAALILAPSYIFLAFIVYRRHRLRSVLMPAALVAAVAPYVTAFVLARALAAEETGGLAAFFLPLFSGVYAVFSPVHLFDILNQLLLVGPVALALLPILILGFRRGEGRLLTFLLVVPASAFIMFFDPKLTLIRDWDLFAVPVATCVIPLLLTSFSRLGDDLTSLLGRILPAALCGVVLMSSWVMLNHSTTAHLTRAEYVLEHSVKGRRYGYELLAHYYHIQDDYQNELRVLQTIDPGDRTPRVYGKLAQAFYKLGRLDEAYAHAQFGVMQTIPNKLNALMAGLTSYDKGKYPEAAYYFRVAMDMDPGDYQWLYLLGDALLLADSLDEAIAVYTQAIDRDPSSPRPFIGLADAYVRKGNYVRAQQYCREGLARDPQSERGKILWEKIKEQLR